jgi:hypothetical protein
MRRNRKTETDLLNELRAQTGLRGGITVVAKQYGFSPAFISDVEKGHTPVTDRLAEAMGYRRVVEFERVA